MSKTSLFHTVNSHISAITNRDHLKTPGTPYRMIVDERANLVVLMTKKEHDEYLESRDRELSAYS